MIQGNELRFSGDFLTIGVMAEVDPSNRVEEANERNNKKTVLPNLYRAVRNLTPRRAYVEELRGKVVTLPTEKTPRMRFIVENTGNVTITRRTVLRAALLRGERGQEVAYETSASPVLRLGPGEKTKVFLVMRDVEPNIVQSEGVPQLALYRLRAEIFPEGETFPASSAPGSIKPDVVIPPDNTFTSDPFYVEESEGHLYCEGDQSLGLQDEGLGGLLSGRACHNGHWGRCLEEIPESQDLFQHLQARGA